MADLDDFTKISNKCARGIALIVAKRLARSAVGNDGVDWEIPNAAKNAWEAEKNEMKQDIVDVVATWGMTAVPIP